MGCTQTPGSVADHAITAEIDEQMTTAGDVIRGLRPVMLKRIPTKFPEVGIRLEGQQTNQR